MTIKKFFKLLFLPPISVCSVALSIVNITYISNVQFVHIRLSQPWHRIYATLMLVLFICFLKILLLSSQFGEGWDTVKTYFLLERYITTVGRVKILQ